MHCVAAVFAIISVHCLKLVLAHAHVHMLAGVYVPAVHCISFVSSMFPACCFSVLVNWDREF